MELDERMTQQIHKIANNHNLQQITISTDSGSSTGDNYLGIIIKVTVTGKDTNNTDKVLNLILKVATSNDEIRAVIPFEHVFGREVYFYSKILPVYNQFLKDNQLPVLQSFPEMLGYDSSAPEFLVMSDMKAMGFVMRPDRAEPLNLSHVDMVMKEYGRFHGLYFALQTLKPELGAEILKNMDSDCYYGKMKGDNPMVTSYVDMANSRAAKALLDEDVEAKEIFDSFSKHCMQRVWHDLKPESAGRFSVINHGDGWVNNMLFKYKDNEKSTPSDLCLLDFQLSRIASPAVELSYFIFACTDQELRDNHMDDILMTYHEAMRCLLQSFALNVDDFMTFEELNEQMRQFSTFGLFMCTEVLYYMLCDSDEIPNYEELMESNGLEETLAAFSFESKNTAAFRTRLRNVILDMIKRGYLKMMH